MNKSDILKISVLVSFAVVFQMIESYFPAPFVGIRLGIANIFTILALSMFGFSVGIQVGILRTIVSSFLLGTFLSPTFFLSFSGALFSSIVMGIFIGKFGLTLKGVSILGAVVHIYAQVAVAYLLLIRNTAIFHILPWLGIISIISGWITGAVAQSLAIRLNPAITEINWETVSLGNIKSDIHYPTNLLNTELKIVFSLILLFLSLVINNIFYLAGLLLSFLIVCRINLKKLFLLKTGVVWLIVSIIVFNLFFTKGKTVWQLNFLSISEEGILRGAIALIRLLFVLGISTWLAESVSVDKLILAMKKMSYPLIKFCPKMIYWFEIIGLSLQLTPLVLTRLNEKIRTNPKKFNLKTIPDFFAETITDIFRIII